MVWNTAYRRIKTLQEQRVHVMPRRGILAELIQNQSAWKRRSIQPAGLKVYRLPGTFFENKNVTDTGIGTKIVNVGDSGAAFSVADGTNLTIMQLLLATNALTDDPDDILGAAKIYDTNGDGVIDAAEAALRVQANLLYTFINEGGDN